MGDTGLLVSHAFSENEIASEELYQNIMNGRLSLNEGMLYENVISQMLYSKGRKLFFIRNTIGKVTGTPWKLIFCYPTKARRSSKFSR